jgi:hypothetical protein
MMRARICRGWKKPEQRRSSLPPEFVADNVKDGAKNPLVAII